MLAENAAFVQELLVKHAGLSFFGEQSGVMASRLALLAKLRNVESVDALVGSLRSSPSQGLIDSVIEALTTHETSFFRDRAAYSALADLILPALVKRRGTQRALSIWSAGCSTGQEPYSVALLLRELFPELARWHVRIWGTDVSRSVVERAREGVYSEFEVRRGLSAAACGKYFVPVGAKFQLRDSVRRMVTWDAMNLTAPWAAIGDFDLILMRNVLIYFSSDVRSSTLAQTASHLARDGYLLLGTSETTFGASTEFTPTLLQGATAYQRVAK